MRWLLLSIAASAALAQAPSPVGTWRGAIDAGDFLIHITMRVAKTSDGGLAVAVDSPERNAKDAKADVVKPTANGFTAEWKSISVRCEATLTSDGAALDTNWDSPEGSAPARLKKEAGADRAALRGQRERISGMLQPATR